MAPSPLPLLVEALEPRLAPAGVVAFTTIGNTLSITGSAGSEHVIITDSPSTGQWAVSYSAADAETVFKLNGVVQEGSSFMITAQSSIKAAMGDGNDQIDILSTNSGMVLTGTLNLTMGKGDDVVQLGDASTQTLVFKGAVSVDLGAKLMEAPGDVNEEADDDILTLAADAVFASTVTIKGGAHNDQIIFLDGFGLDGGSSIHTFQKGLTVDLGTGSDQFVVHSEWFRVSGGAISVKGAGDAGQDQLISFAPAEGWMDGAVSVATGAGKTFVNIGRGSNGDQLHFAAGLNIVTGSGDDGVLFRGNVTIAGGLSADLKEGDNAVVMGEASLLKAGSVSLKGGASRDLLFLDKNCTVVVNGALTLNLGGGVNALQALQAQGGQALIAGSFNQTGTTGTDSFLFQGASLNILGNAAFAFGAAHNSLRLEATAIAYVGGNVSLTGTVGDDFVGMAGNAVTVVGNVTLNVGNGYNVVSVGGATDISGNLTFTGGIDDDIFETFGARVRIGRAFTFMAGDAGIKNILDVHAGITSFGSVKYQGTKGVDTILFGRAGANTSVVGTTVFNVGSGTGEVNLEQVVLHGSLNVTSSTLADQADKLTIARSILFGASTVSLGAGSSAVSVDDTAAWDTFAANLGAGNDVVNLDVSEAHASGNSWYGLVKINLGAGNDTANLGSDKAETFNFFAQAVVVDGGAGTDILTDESNTYLVGTEPTKLSIP